MQVYAKALAFYEQNEGLSLTALVSCTLPSSLVHCPPFSRTLPFSLSHCPPLSQTALVCRTLCLSGASGMLCFCGAVLLWCCASVLCFGGDMLLWCCASVVLCFSGASQVHGQVPIATARSLWRDTRMLYAAPLGFCGTLQKNKKICGRKAKINGRCGLHRSRFVRNTGSDSNAILTAGSDSDDNFAPSPMRRLNRTTTVPSSPVHCHVLSRALPSSRCALTVL
jgi:hypothetical protein